MRVGRDATLKHASLTFGGDLVRIFATGDYDGPGGDVELLGLYFADAGQHLEHRLIDGPRGAELPVAGALQGRAAGKSAHTVWVGDVLIRPEPSGTDTYEMNRNLLLTDGCRAPTRSRTWRSRPARSSVPATPAPPDVSTTSSCSTCCPGAFPRTVARRLVVRGFFGEVLHRIGIPSVVEHASEIVEPELAVAGI